MESKLCEILFLGLDLAWFTIFYKLYISKKKTVEEVMIAPVMDLDSKLKVKVTQYASSTVPYCVVKGSVQSKGPSMKSNYVGDVKGVIKEVVLKEHKVKWNSLSRFWSETKHVIKRSVEDVPFVLHNGSVFKPVCVEVEDPLAAEYLTLSTVYDHFTPNEQSFGAGLLGWARGECSKGFQEIEAILIDGTVLTGIGELVLENDNFKLKTPSNGLSYILTTMPKEVLIKKLWDEARIYRIFATVLGLSGLFLVSWIIKSSYSEWKLIARKKEEAKQREESRRLRRHNNREECTEAEHVPKCVVCLTNNIEVIILECGHACLCIDCAGDISEFCPVCRSPIERTALAYLP